MNKSLQTRLLQERNHLLLVGVFGLIVCAVVWMFWPTLMARAYLVAYQFWLGIPLGSLVLLMIYHLTGGHWGSLLRRILEAATLTLPLMAVLFLPLWLRMTDLYPWTNPEFVADHPHLQHKEGYLNVDFFTIRAIVYFLVWIFLAWRLRHWSRRQDEQDDPKNASRLGRLSGPGLVLYGLTITFASTDWVMSLQPLWFSTIFYMIYAMLQLLSGLTFGVLMLVWMRHDPPFDRELTPKWLGTLGNLLLAFVMLWMYAAFSQWMLTWTANLPEEIAWYLPRLEGGWKWVGLGLIAFQFGIPFLFLLSHDVKRNPRVLAGVACFVLVMCIVNWFWQVMPSFGPVALGNYAAELVAVILAILGIGSLWLAMFGTSLAAAPLLLPPKNRSEP